MFSKSSHTNKMATQLISKEDRATFKECLLIVLDLVEEQQNPTSSNSNSNSNSDSRFFAVKDVVQWIKDFQKTYSDPYAPLSTALYSRAALDLALDNLSRLDFLAKSHIAIGRILAKHQKDFRITRFKHYNNLSVYQFNSMIQLTDTDADTEH